MQKELQLALLVIGGLFIVGILVHGFWTTRKQQNREAPNRYESRRTTEPQFNNDDDTLDVLDDAIISPARIVEDDGKPIPDNVVEAQFIHDSDVDVEVKTTDESVHENQYNESEEEKNGDDRPMYSGVVTQPKPEFVQQKKEPVAEEVPPPPSFILKKQQDEEPANVTSEDRIDEPKKELEQKAFTLTQAKNAEKKEIKEEKKEEDISLAEQAKRLVRRRSKTLAEKIRKEPKLGNTNKNDDQMRIDFGESGASPSTQEVSGVSQEEPTAPAQDVIILNVQTSQDNPISGAALLQMLLTLGFKFGEHDIFHRHVNTNGKGPILFSLANIFKPGVFDIDNMENFTTQGLSLFMMLPIEGEAQQVFNMMHNAARKIADEFNCKILDANKVPISNQSLQQYVERIRAFERQQMSR